MRRIITHLSFYVLIAIITGVLVGIYMPSFALTLEPLSKYFISIIKIFTFPIIFLTVTLGISSMGDLKKVGDAASSRSPRARRPLGPSWFY